MMTNHSQNIHDKACAIRRPLFTIDSNITYLGENGEGVVILYNRKEYSRDSFYGNDYSEQRAIAFKRILYEETGNDNNWNIILNKIGVVYDAVSIN